MKNEQKELLIKDLCCRLPYGVKGITEYGSVSTLKDWKTEQSIIDGIKYGITKYSWRPYLFSMSSMTKEQRKEYSNLLDEILDEFGHAAHFDTIESIDWLLKHHFDWRGLIPMGLAIDCTNLNIY